MPQNNVITQVEVGVPLGPDMTGLQGMQNPTVTAWKLIPRPGNKREGLIVINNKRKLNADQICKLQDEVVDTVKYPLGGPGLYRFEVTDAQSSAKVYWETRVGNQNPDEEEPAATPGASAARSVPAADLKIPVSVEIENLGNGWLYHARYGLLTLPNGRMIKWQAGDPPPDLAASAAHAAPPPLANVSTPVGTSPELEALRAKTETLMAELARTKEEARERARQEEIAALREENRKQAETQQTRFEALVEKLTSKPAVDPMVAELQRKLEERERQDALRTEMAAKLEAITAMVREAQANKGPDPMVGMLMENMRILRDSTKDQVTSVQASSDRMLEFMGKQAEIAQSSGTSLISEKFVGVLSGVMDTMLRVKETEAKLSGLAGGGINWMDLIERMTDKAGTALNAIMQVQSRKAAAATAQAQADIVRTQAVAQRQAALPAAPAPAVVPSAAAPLVGEAARDALAEQMFPKPTSTPAPVAPTEPSAAADAPAPAVPPATALPAQVPTQAPGQARTRRNNALAKASLADLHKAFDGIPDPEFFGPFVTSVVDLREEFIKDPNQYSTDDVAQFVVTAQTYIGQAIRETKTVPVVAQLLSYGKFPYIFERMLPDQGPEFWGQAAVALAAKIAAERATASAKG